LTRARQDFNQTLRVHRFEQVVEGVNLEGANGVVVERRHEYGVKRASVALEQVEPTFAPELDVEEDSLRLLAPDQRLRFIHAARLSNSNDIGFGGELPPQRLPSQPLVVHHNNA
jgi:hypothetical protein